MTSFAARERYRSPIEQKGPRRWDIAPSYKPRRWAIPTFFVSARQSRTGLRSPPTPGVKITSISSNTYLQQESRVSYAPHVCVLAAYAKLLSMVGCKHPASHGMVWTRSLHVDNIEKVAPASWLNRKARITIVAIGKGSQVSLQSCHIR